MNTMHLRLARAGWSAALALVVGCSSGPPPPDWQLDAKSGLAQAVDAYLSGNDRVASSAFARARGEVARTARVDLAARVELTRCAARVASLVLDRCEGFEPLRGDAPAAERAYADYLAGRMPADTALLPAAQRRIAGGGGTLEGIDDPLASLVAAGVLLQLGRASPAVVAQAVDTASAQGWRRPLLAWLGVQARLAEQGGDADEAARLRRRMALVQGTP